jgi:GAF domain-containing protein
MALNVLEDPLFKEKELARKMGLVSILSVPMSIRDRVVGVINTYTSEPHEFTETEQNIFTTVANQAAVAIVNTELMVKTKVIQEELETRKLVERAKEILLRRRNLSSEQAFRWIQKRSMDSRKSMREIAEAVLLSEEI